ncbi:hypothetical protein ABPG75_006497 [Micractinium tetrahymenae]
MEGAVRAGRERPARLSSARSPRLPVCGRPSSCTGHDAHCVSSQRRHACRPLPPWLPPCSPHPQLERLQQPGPCRLAQRRAAGCAVPRLPHRRARGRLGENIAARLCREPQPAAGRLLPARLVGDARLHGGGAVPAGAERERPHRPQPSHIHWAGEPCKLLRVLPADGVRLEERSFDRGCVQLDNFGGLWVGDRTLSDKTSKFVPTPDNIVFLPNITQIEAAGPKNVSEWDWAIYPGNWGAPLQDGTTTFVCFTDNQTAVTECPDTQAARALRTAFKLLDRVQGAMGKESAAAGTAGFEGEVYKIQSTSNNSWVPPAAITGPLYRMWSYQWLPQRTSPIFADFNASTDTIICPNDSIVTRSYPDYSGALSPSSSLDTIVSYLVGMCVGSIVTSMFFILVMMVPSLISKAVGAPSKLLAKGGEAWAAGRSRLKKGGNAVAGALAAPAAKKVADGRQPHCSSQVELLQGDSAAAMAGALPPASQDSVGSGTDGSAAAAADPKAAALPVVPKSAASALAVSNADLAPAASAASAASSLSAEELEVVLSDEVASHANTPLYLLWAVVCYAIAVVLLAIGTESFVHNSVSALATGVIGQSAPIEAVKWLIIGSLILAGVCDLFALFIVLLATRERFTLWKWSRWVERHTFKLHIVTAGLVILVLSISCIVFGLGLVVMTVQLAARVACSMLADINIDDFRVADVCVSVQSLSDEPICGWQALEVCYNVTSMRVLLISLGAMLLLWSHIIWLVLLLLSMWRYKEWRVVVPRAQAARLPAAASEAALFKQGGAKDDVAPAGSEAAALEPAPAQQDEAA